MYTRRSHERFVGPSRLGLPQNTCTFASTCVYPVPAPVTTPLVRSPHPHTHPHLHLYLYLVSVYSFCASAALFCSVLLVSGLSMANRVKCCVLWPANVAVESVSVTSSSSSLLTPRHCLCHCWTAAANRGTELGSRRGRGRDISTRGLQANK